LPDIRSQDTIFERRTILDNLSHSLGALIATENRIGIAAFIQTNEADEPLKRRGAEKEVCHVTGRKPHRNRCSFSVHSCGLRPDCGPHQ
jgi:hypothetical protein